MQQERLYDEDEWKEGDDGDWKANTSNNNPNCCHHLLTVIKR